MNGKRKLRIKSLYLSILEIDSPEKREAYLNEECAGDKGLQAEIKQLLGFQEKMGSFLEVQADEPVATLAVSSEIRAPQQIGRYKIREQLGEGGMGVVYVAEQTEPVRRKVALKIIKPGMDSKQVIARFEAERQALAMMSHPNIAKVLDGGTTDDGRPYFVMELVKGIPITEFCDQQSLSIKERLELMIRVCQAVQHAHLKGIIHRDLKPSNVMVELHDVEPVPKVIDFGIAKATSQQLTQKTIYTEYSQLVGTPLYMSPEQAQLSGLDVDTRSDIYSLGVLFYELLTGVTPFEEDKLRGVGFDEMRRIIREDDPQRPSDRVSTIAAEAISTISERRKLDERTLASTIRGELDWIVMKALEKDRNRRYETAAALIDDVNRYLDGRSVQAVPPSVTYQLRKLVHRHKTVLTTASLIAFALVGGISVSLWYANEARREAIAAQQARQLADERLNESQTARQDADANYQIALQTVDSMLLGLVDDQVARVPVTSRNRLLADARRLFDHLLKYNASDTEVLLQRARVYAYLLEPEQALADYEQVLRLKPEHAQAHADLAKFLGHNLDLRYRRRSEALQHARQAIEIEPDSAEFHLILGFLNREDDPQQALSLLDRAIELDPSLAGAYLRRGMVQWDQGEREVALGDVERSLQLNPEFAAAVRFRAEMLAESDHDDAALEAYTQAITLDPYSPHAYLGRAIVRWRLGDLEQANQDMDSAQHLAPSYPVSYQQSAQLRTQRGQYREALEDIHRQIAEQPKNLELRRRRGEIYLQLQRYEEAQSDFDAFIARQPDFSYVYKRRAVSRFYLGNVDAALDDLEKAVTLNPTDQSTVRWITPRKFLANATREQRERLIRLADRVVQLNETKFTHSAALSERARVYFGWGEPEKGIADCLEAIKRTPTASSAWYHLAISKLEQNDENHYRKICTDILPQVRRQNESSTAADFAVWLFAIAPDSQKELDTVIGQAERNLKHTLEQERWWENTGDIGPAWLRHQILGALLYRNGKLAEALQHLRLADIQYSHLSTWPPYSRFFIAMIYAEQGNLEEAQRWQTRATNWADEALKEDSDCQWSHRVVLGLLSREADQVVAAAVATQKSNDSMTNQ